MASKKIKEEKIISINPMQDDLEKLSGLGRSVAGVAGVKEAVKRTGKKIKATVDKAVGAESKFNKALENNPKKTMAGIVAGIGVAKKKKWDEGGYDKDMSSTEGSFKKGGSIVCRGNRLGRSKPTKIC